MLVKDIFLFINIVFYAIKFLEVWVHGFSIVSSEAHSKIHHYEYSFTLFIHQASPTGATKQVQLTL